MIKDAALQKMIAAEKNIPCNYVEAALWSLLPVESLDQLGYDEYFCTDEFVLQEFHAQEESVEDIVSNHSRREHIVAILSELTDKEKRVLELRFGVDDDNEKTLEMIGSSFGVTRERIRQIELKALRKMRHPSRSSKLKDFLD